MKGYTFIVGGMVWDF